MADVPNTGSVPVAPPSGPAGPGPVVVQTVPLFSDPIAIMFMASLIDGLSELLSTDGPVSWRAALRALLGALGTVVRYRKNTVVQ